MPWNPDIPVPNPPGLLPCRFCGEYCMETEQVEDGLHDPPRGKLIRINAMCDAIMPFADEKDDERTSYAPEAGAVAEWNERFGKEAGG